ncbi:hydrogenase maturation nickel metallochaperone HypA [Candidatus Bipolaricaulota bacterium]|nr:hydrogenase maturation nickel metallochaperone HypA [Candidatus Bipolaricaulota bacterium]
MHEYSLAHSLLEGLLEHLSTHPVEGRVVKVHVRQGELLILSQEALGEAWRLLSEGTPLAGSELEIERVPVRVRCPGCGYQGDARYLAEEGWHQAIPVLACPQCEARVEVVEGKELVITNLTVEDRQPP